jgi:hypothetical protein
MNVQPAKSTILKLEPNVPTELALHNPNGLEVSGHYGPQVLFTLTGGMRFYVPLDVGKEIRSLSLAPGQPFIVTKGQKRGEKRFEWQVERSPVPPVSSRPSPDSGVKTATQIEHALKTAIAACCSAEKFATEIGYTVRFSEQSIKSLACTVLIEMGRAA